MGNMVFNARVKDDIGISSDGEEGSNSSDSSSDIESSSRQPTTGGSKKPVEHRIHPSHMYTGPLKLGDPYYRGLSKMENDPMLPARMRDTARSELCQESVREFSACTQKAGFALVYACTKERDALVKCIEGWLENPKFKERVAEEYLNERSHFRETGVKTKRYERGTFIPRDEELDGPPLDKDGLYRPRKPKDWDEHVKSTYKESGPPKWANFQYDTPAS